jgi:outer membrane receptor protein involved in Fe transport
MRVPTPMELTCADPGAPCKLPSSFLSDPPLRAVVSRTVEAGARGKLSPDGNWSAAIFRTELYDDIQFVRSTGTTAAGYFQNVGRTRREGLELAAASRHGGLELAARYGFTRATYESAFLESSPNNSTADSAGAIHVRPGDRIASVPAHTLKLRAAYDFGDSASIAANVVCASAAYARGDENNRDRNGTVPGYAILTLDARWRVVPDIEIFARIDNVTDTRYANFGVLGQNFFPGPERTFAPGRSIIEQFRGPGAPRGAWVGIRFSWP